MYNFRFQVVSSNLFSEDIGSYQTYGLLSEEETSDGWLTGCRIDDVSCDLQFVKWLSKLFTTFQLDPIHLFDAVADALP